MGRLHFQRVKYSHNHLLQIQDVVERHLHLSTSLPNTEEIFRLREIPYLYANAEGISHNHAYIKKTQLSTTSNGKDTLDEEAMEANLELNLLIVEKL